jgi:hypothetical protein
MNTDRPTEPGKTNDAKRNNRLLETILAIRSSVGEGLSDDELTRLLWTTLLSEAGFGFLSFSKGLVTLTVPEQDLARWYPEQGWIAPEKENVAGAIAEKYELSLHEPADASTSYWHPVKGPQLVHHHIELNDRRQTVIVAHPQYLKVRVLGRSGRYRHDWEAHCPVVLGPEILQDLSALYAQV